MVTSPEVSWLFFKARAKRPYLSHTGRASNAEKQPTGPGPKGCDENGPAAALLVGHVSVHICSLLAPCRRPILIATKYLVFRGQDTRSCRPELVSSGESASLKSDLYVRFCPVSIVHDSRCCQHLHWSPLGRQTVRGDGKREACDPRRK